MGELDGILALLVLVAAGLLWVALEVRRLHDAIQPLASSRIARALSEA